MGFFRECNFWGGKNFEDGKIWNFWELDGIREKILEREIFLRDFWGSEKIFGGFLGGKKIFWRDFWGGEKFWWDFWGKRKIF